MTASPETPAVNGEPFDLLRLPIQRAAKALVAAARRAGWRTPNTIPVAELTCSRASAYKLGSAVRSDGPLRFYWSEDGEPCRMRVTYGGGVFHVRESSDR